MAAKTVALDDEAYALLRERKRSSETFSDVVKRVARPRRPLTDFIGAWAGDSKAEATEFDRARADLRKRDLGRVRRLSRRENTG